MNLSISYRSRYRLVDGDWYTYTLANCKRAETQHPLDVTCDSVNVLGSLLVLSLSGYMVPEAAVLWLQGQNF